MEIIRLNQDNCIPLQNFYEYNHKNFTYFTPHDWDITSLYNMLLKAKKDAYFSVNFGGIIIAYGMLRGLDEGYANPRLGIAVDRQLTGYGIGSLLLTFMERYCKLLKYTYVDLKVHRDNMDAIKLYASHNYTFGPGEHASYLYGIKDL